MKCLKKLVGAILLITLLTGGFAFLIENIKFSESFDPPIDRWCIYFFAVSLISCIVLGNIFPSKLNKKK